MTFAYVCTNYNNSHFTRTAVETLLGGARHPDAIIVIDNGSDAANVGDLRSLITDHDQVEVIFNPDNSGYFPGLNIGLAHLRATRPEIKYVVIGNNDLEFPPDFADRLEAIMPALAHNPVVSPNIVTMDGLHQNPHVTTGLSRARELVYDLYHANYHLAKLIGRIARVTRRFTDRSDERGHETAQYIYQGHGSCYILTPRFSELFGSFWAPTFLMGEEYFLSKQLSDKGFKIYYEPGIIIRHHCNGAIQNVPSRRIWEIARAAHREYRRYIKPWRKQG